MDNRERILVVDDDFMNLKVVEYILKEIKDIEKSSSSFV